MPNGRPGFRPEWRHRTLTLPIGKGRYTFRTLSLYDVWCLFEHIEPIYSAILKGRPIEFASHFKGVLDHLCPGLTDSDDFKEWNTAHYEAVQEFYWNQDWSRIKVLADRLGENSSAGKEPPDPERAHRTFLLICSAASRSVSQSVPDFMEERFEFCADTITTLYERMKEEEAAAAMTTDQLFLLLSSTGATEKVGDKPKPAWIQEIEEKSRVQ